MQLKQEDIKRISKEIAYTHTVNEIEDWICYGENAEIVINEIDNYDKENRDEGIGKEEVQEILKQLNYCDTSLETANLIWNIWAGQSQLESTVSSKLYRILRDKKLMEKNAKCTN